MRAPRPSQMIDFVVPHDHAVLDPPAPLHVGAAADDAAAQAGAGPDVGVVMDDGPVEEGVRLDDHVRADDAVLPHAHALLHLGVVADQDGRDEDGVRVDLGPLAEPYPGPDLEPPHVHPHPALQDVLVGVAVCLQAADVLPVAVGHPGVERGAHREQLREDVGGEVDRAALGDLVEHLGLEHVDPGVDGVGEHLAPVGLLEEALDAAVLGRDHDPELEGILHPLRDHRAERPGAAVEGHDVVQADVGEGVPRDDHERLLELLGRVPHAPRGAERTLLGRVGQVDAHVGAVAEVIAHLAGQELHGDHDVLDAVVADVPDDVLHHRPVGEREHRLRLVGGQRPKAGALAAGHDHGLHGAASSLARGALPRSRSPRWMGSPTARQALARAARSPSSAILT